MLMYLPLVYWSEPTAVDVALAASGWAGDVPDSQVMS